jgi:hypothetical protein
MVCVTGGGKDWKDPQLCIHLLYVMIKVRSTFYSLSMSIGSQSQPKAERYRVKRFL